MNKLYFASNRPVHPITWGVHGWSSCQGSGRAPGTLQSSSSFSSLRGWAPPAPFLGVVVTLVIFLQHLQKNLYFHSAFTLLLFPAGYKEREVRMLHHHGLAPLGGGSVFPSRCNFSLLPLCSSGFFYKTSSKCFYHKLGYILQYKWSI